MLLLSACASTPTPRRRPARRLRRARPRGLRPELDGSPRPREPGLAAARDRPRGDRAPGARSSRSRYVARKLGETRACIQPVTLQGGSGARASRARPRRATAGGRTAASCIEPGRSASRTPCLPCGAKLFFAYGDSPQILTQVIDRRPGARPGEVRAHPGARREARPRRRAEGPLGLRRDERPAT